MNTRNWQRLAHSTLTLVWLVIVAGSSACDSGYKQIGGLDGGASDTSDDDDGDDDGDGGDGDGGELECIEQDIDVEAGPLLPSPEQDLLLECAANVEPSGDGWRVTFTQCSDDEGDPQVDREIVLSGLDWPEPELADGDQPLHEVRYLSTNAGNGHSSRVLIVRTLGYQRVSLVVFEGTEMLLDPTHIGPLWISLDEAACTAGPLPCTPETMYQEFPVGFALGYGDAFGNVAHDMMLTDFGIEEGASTVYDVLVGFAVTHECYDDGDFRELQLGIVARTVGAP
jgi:hypothetical protein